MSRRCGLIWLLALMLLVTGPHMDASAQSIDQVAELSGVFNQHGAVMLLIDPNSGAIVDANRAASEFYGHSKAELLSMRINEINTMSPDAISAEMNAAKEERRDYFLFKHLLASGEVRTVEVFSYPVDNDGRSVLFSIIYDVTDKVLLEGKTKDLTVAGFALGVFVLVLLTLLLSLSTRSRRRLQEANREIADTNSMLRTFIDAQGDWVYLKDSKLRYVFVNRSFECFYGKKADQIIGLDDYALTTESSFADLRRKTDLDALEKGTIAHDEIIGDGKVFATTKFPVRLADGQTGVGAYVRDVTQQRLDEKRSEKANRRHRILADVLSRSFSSAKEQLDYVLHEALKLTESQYGYIFLYDEGRRELALNSWTEGVLADCRIANQRTVYPLDEAGFWGEAVRQKKPVVLNDFQNPHPLKKGYPEGHVVLTRFLSIPVIMDERVVAVVGLANKPNEYDESDVSELGLFMSSAWNALKRHEIQEKLTYERSRYLQTLVSIGDGVMVVDREGHIEMLNAVAQKLTGWDYREAIGRYYTQVFVIRHEHTSEQIEDPIAAAMETGTLQELSHHAVLISKDGQEYNLEDSAAPIRTEAGEMAGVVLVFRDVTQRRQQLEQIEYLSFHDPLTGLYNRRFFNEEIRRLDTQRNLPLTVVMGDVNGLKLTNDIFGHASGDQLLERVGDVLRRCCRADDIIARWGGDEYVLLMPKTEPAEAEKLIARIKLEFSKEKVKSIKGSISMGLACKDSPETDVATILSKAEEVMYNAKVLERDEVRKSTVGEILATLFSNSVREREHSESVSELAQTIGRALNLPEGEIRKLRDAGYLHDIGKIILDSKLLNINHHLSDYEWSEIKRHPIVGFRILNAFDDTVDLAEPVLAHQERWDGSGYPRGIKGNEIPLLARIIAVAEGYDRMIHDSANTRAMSREAAIRTLRENAGTQFDPKIVEVFTQALGQGVEGGK